LAAGFVISRRALLLTASFDVVLVILLGGAVSRGHIKFGQLPDPIQDVLSTGALIVFTAALALLYDRGRHGAALKAEGVLHELTEKNRALQLARDRADESNRAKTDFLARMSHEVRTPMSGVLGMNELLLQSGLQEEQQEYARLIRKSAKSLLAVLDDILDFSRLASGEFRLDSCDFDPRSPTEQAVSVLAQAARRRGLELTCLVTPEVPRRIQGAPDRIHQVLVNLLSNAIKYTGDGDVAVLVDREEIYPGSVHVRFEVKDSGPGFSFQERKHLFDPFYQVDSSTTRRHGGTGLGLAICRELVNKMSGRIGVESEEGAGSKFWFSVPATEPVRRNNLDLEWSPALSGRRLLWLGRQGSAASTARVYLEFWGAVLVHAESAAKLSVGSSLDDFDLVLMDSEDSVGVSDTGDGPVIVLVPPDASVSGTTGHRAVRLRKPVQEGSLLLAVCRGLQVEAPPWLAQERSNEVDSGSTPGDVGLHTRVLVVEDNAINRRLSVEVLRRKGYVVETAESGAEALEKVARAPYNLVLMDCQMPELDGYDTSEAIRGLEGEAAQVPIVAVTAHALEGERERCLRSGMNDFLAKPFFPDQLVAIVEKWA